MVYTRVFEVFGREKDFKIVLDNLFNTNFQALGQTVITHERYKLKQVFQFFLLFTILGKFEIHGSCYV